MKKTLEYYANPEFWGKLYGGYQNDERLWLGAGPGRMLAEETLKQVNKDG